MSIHGTPFWLGGNVPAYLGTIRRGEGALTIRYVAARRDDNGERTPQPPHPQAAGRATQDRTHDITFQALRDHL